MDRAARARWSILCAVFVGTLAAIAYPSDETVYVPLPATDFVSARPISLTMRSTEPLPPGIVQRDWVATDENPFVPKGWQAPPPTPEPERTVVTIETGQAEGAPPLPASLPYTFIGQMADDGNRVVYLGRGEQLLLARSGDVLEDTYKVVDIGPSQIDFETVATGLRQTLAIPAQNRP